MPECPSCSHVVDESSKFCPECGKALSIEFEPTQHYTAEANADSSFTSSSPSVHGRFVPGSRVADRYRIVSLAGKGGMGEVYRADDLKLGQTVALKFLPDHVARNPKRLELFLNEVRLTRQISHPNVCRVHDIGEVDGQTFLSMEYVDGEDLRVLLRRIGRLPPERGLQIARQICAGVAAAHEQGVLHRDLKPANVMIDGEGRVRVTDFGLAKLAVEEGEAEVAGTPAYMAPEQLDRGEASKRSDVYSLGLVLYELFTGRPVHEGRSILELLESHRESTPSLPSELVEGIDPAVERVILRCLSRDPGQRPESAAVVAAALPGGDPLTAALLAGETPSPDLVAASGGSGTLSMRVGLSCIAVLGFVLLGFPFLISHLHAKRVGWSSDFASPTVLESTVIRDGVLGPLGYWSREHESTTHSVHGMQFRRFGDRERLEFWYRQSNPGFLTPDGRPVANGPRIYGISATNPSPRGAGMVSVRTDLAGRLVELVAPSGPSFEAHDEDWSELLYAKSLSPDAEPNGLPPLIADTRRDSSDSEAARPTPLGDVYTTPPVPYDRVAVYGDEGEVLGNRRVIFGWNRGRVVYFFSGRLEDLSGQPSALRSFSDRMGLTTPGPSESRLGLRRQFYPESEPVRVEHTSIGSGRTQKRLLQIAVYLLAILFGTRNVLAGRADSSGALHFAMWMGTCQLVAWVFAFDHRTSVDRESQLLVGFLWYWGGYVFRYWLYYVALEPYVRRYWPHTLVAWTRATDGRVRDPLVGRELLVGCTVGACAALAISGCELAWPSRLVQHNLDPNSPFRVTSSVVAALYMAPGWSVWWLTQLFLWRLLFRRTWPAIVAFVGVFAFAALSGDFGGGQGISVLVFYPVFAILLTRFGLLAGATYCFTWIMLHVLLVTTDTTHGYGDATFVALGGVLLVAAYGFYTSTLAPACPEKGAG